MLPCRLVLTCSAVEVEGWIVSSYYILRVMSFDLVLAQLLFDSVSKSVRMSVKQDVWQFKGLTQLDPETGSW